MFFEEQGHTYDMRKQGIKPLTVHCLGKKRGSIRVFPQNGIKKHMLFWGKNLQTWEIDEEILGGSQESNAEGQKTHRHRSRDAGRKERIDGNFHGEFK